MKQLRALKTIPQFASFADQGCCCTSAPIMSASLNSSSSLLGGTLVPKPITPNSKSNATCLSQIEISSGAYTYISTKQIRDRGNRHKRVHLCFLPSIQHAGCFPNRAFSIRPTCIQPPRSSAPARIGWHRLKAEER